MRKFHVMMSDIKKFKIFPLCLVSFLLAFNYFILKALKDTLLVTADEAGAEALPFVKMWLLFPISVVFIGVFTWIAHRVSIRAAFTSIISFFLATYCLFTFVCYPYRESLHLHGVADYLQTILPTGWKGLVAMVRYWSYSLFYVTAECWCTMVYSVVFWGYANEVTKYHDARKYYPYLTLAGTLAAIVAGPIVIFLSQNANLSWDQTLYSLTLLVLACGILALVIFLKWSPSPATVEAQQTEKVPLWSSFNQVFRSKYLLTLALIGFTYNMVINLTEVVWKNEILKLYPNPSDFTAYLSYVTFLTGIVSTLFTLFICRQSLKLFGWTVTTMITPVIALVTGILFFSSIFTNELGLISVSLSTITFLGSMHICLSCGGKYTLFEPAKEIAFLPLDSTQKLNGKIAIDGIGTRLGKTSSSIIYQALLMGIPTITACTPYIGGIILMAIILCIGCVSALGKEIEGKTQLA